MDTTTLPLASVGITIANLAIPICRVPVNNGNFEK